MKTKFNGLLALGVLALSTVCLTGCHKNIDYGATANFQIPSDGWGNHSETNPMTITFYQTTSDSTGYGTTLRQYIAEFEEKYPWISVDVQQPGSYDDINSQIKTELTAGKEPHVAFCYADHVASYLKTGKVIQLDALIESSQTVKDGEGNDVQIGLTEDEVNDFISGYYEEGKKFEDGYMYTLPFLKSTEILYYDKTEFTNQGIEVPTHWFSESDSDTTSMEYVCKKLKELHPSDTALGYDSEANWFITMTEQLGSGYTVAESPYFKFNNKKNREFVKTFRQWHKNGWVETGYTYGNGSSSYTSGLFTEDDASSPRCYMCIGSSAGASHQLPDNNRFEVGVAAIPQVGDSKKVISQGPSICLFNKTDPAEVLASWMLVKYLCTNASFQAEYAMKSGYVPVLKSVNDIDVYSEFLNYDATTVTAKEKVIADSAKLCLNLSDYYFVSPAFLGSSDARSAVQSLMYNALIAENEDDIDDLFKTAIDKCEYAII